MPPFQSFPKSYLATSPSHHFPIFHPPKNCSISHPLPYYRSTAPPHYLGTSPFLILFRIPTPPSHHLIIMYSVSLLTLTWGALGGGFGRGQKSPRDGFATSSKNQLNSGPFGGSWADLVLSVWVPNWSKLSLKGFSSSCVSDTTTSSLTTLMRFVRF